MIYQHTLTFHLPGRGIHAIQEKICEALQKSSIKVGICHLFLHHTSASLILCENADPDVKYDTETFFKTLVKDADPIYRHTQEGPDDMAAHLRNLLTGSDLTIPLTHGQLNLGIWQGLYLYEHRISPMQRQLTLTIIGD